MILIRTFNKNNNCNPLKISNKVKVLGKYNQDRTGSQTFEDSATDSHMCNKRQWAWSVYLGKLLLIPGCSLPLFNIRILIIISLTELWRLRIYVAPSKCQDPLYFMFLHTWAQHLRYCHWISAKCLIGRCILISIAAEWTKTLHIGGNRGHSDDDTFSFSFLELRLWPLKRFYNPLGLSVKDSVGLWKPWMFISK